MIENHELCYNALKAHDTRFDGHFFVAVSSTGIYCRPVCPARTPKPENCQFYGSASAAESDGYRPCMKCRPELAPGNSSIDSTKRLAKITAQMIEEGALTDTPLSELAQVLAVSDRHLRRTFKSVYGVSPQRYAQTQRLLLAKRLLTDTDLSMTEVAMNAGFSSLRRFNGQFKSHYQLTPSSLRKGRKSQPEPNSDSDRLQFTLSYRPPFDWPRLISFLNQRSIAGVESAADGQNYRRTVCIDHGKGRLSGWISISNLSERNCLKLVLDQSLAPAIATILNRTRQVFDLDCNPEPISLQLGELAASRPGLRLPGAFDSFEMAVRAILGQQVSVKAAHTLAGRIAATFGESLDTPYEELDRIFPSAHRLSLVDPMQIKGLGIVTKRANTIVALAQAIDSGELCLSRTLNIEETIQKLQSIPGIGPWTAQYIAMRALSWPDAFPDSDLGIIKALGMKRPKELREHAQQWRPWRAYAVMHLWAGLSESG